MPLTKIKSLGITDGTIVNADINASAAIDSTKLSGVQGKFESALFHVRDEKATGTDGGSASATTFMTRTLNTSVTNEISGASLASNQITLPSGTYYINCHAPSFKTEHNQLRLRNITDSSNTLVGTSTYARNTYDVNNRSFLTGRFTIAAQKVFEIQHYTYTAQTGTGLGVQGNAGLTEVYTDAQIWKIA